jgi:hypothetical protein
MQNKHFTGGAATEDRRYKLGHHAPPVSLDLDLFTVFRMICLDFNQSKVET